jgi:hypothetical protein
MSEPIAFTERFVVRADTGQMMARVWLADRLRTKRLWVLLTLIYLCVAAILLSGMDPDFRLWVRIVWAAIFALVPLAILVAALAVMVYVMTLRNARTRLVVGSLLEAGFGPDALVVKNPLSESRIRYDGITSVRRRGEFVLLRQVGMPVTSVYPAALFPDDALDRIRAAAR